MTFRLALALAIALACVSSGVAQGPPPITTSQVILPVNVGSLTPATQANTALVGNPGPQTIYYWMVSNFTLGPSSPIGPFPVSNAPNVLSGSNYIAISPVYPSGIASIDLLKTSSPTPPSDACNCAVATAVTSGTINDQSNTTSAYTVSPVITSNFTYTLTNEVVSTGKADPILRQNGVFIADLANITPGGIVSSNQQVIFNNVGALVGSNGLLFNTGTSALTVAGVVSGSSFTGTGSGAFNAVGVCGSLPSVSANNAGLGFGAGCVPSANTAGGGWQPIVLLNQNNSYGSNTFQLFPGGGAVIGSVASDLGGGTPIGALYILQNGLHGNPHLTFFDGNSGEQSMTPNDSACDFAAGCTGTGGPVALQNSPSFKTPFLGDFTATSGTFNLMTWDVFDYSLFTGGTASCTATPASGHTKGCYDSVLGLTASYNGDSFSKVLRVSDATTLTVPINQVLSATGAIATLADGNNPLTINSAQTSNNQSAINFGETSAATGGSGNNEVNISTAANSASTVLNLSQGAISTVFPTAELNVTQAANTGATNVPIAVFSGTWNNASIGGPFFKIAVTNTSSTAGSPIFQVFGGAAGTTSEFQVNTAGFGVTPNGYQGPLYEGATLAAGTQFCGGPCTASLTGAAGAALYQGGDNSSANAAAFAGPSIFRAGMLTTATPAGAQLEGMLQLGSGFIKGTVANFGDGVSATTTAFNATDVSHTAPILPILGCVTSTSNPIGVVGEGQALCKVDVAIAALGDVICTGLTTDGVLHDNGTNMCLKPGSLVGVVIADSGTITGMTGATTGNTAMSTTLVLVHLSRGGGGPATQMLTSAYTNSSTTTYSTVFTIPVQASQNIHVECHLYYQGSATTAVPSIQFTGPASPTMVRYGMLATLTSGSSPTYYDITTSAGYSTKLTPTAIVTTATDMNQRVTFDLQNGTTGGNVLFQAAPNGAGTLTYQVGSSCVESAQ